MSAFHSRSFRTLFSVHIVIPVVAALAWSVLAIQPVAAAERQQSGPRLRVATDADGLLRIERAAVHQALDRYGQVVLEDITLDGGRAVSLQLEPFRVTTPETRFVVGRRGGPDVPLDFDPDSVLLLRGTVESVPGSSVFLALSEYHNTGRISLGAGQPSFWLSSRAAGNVELPANHLNVFRATGQAGGAPPVPFCGVTESRTPAAAGGPSFPLHIEQQLELAIDTDYEYFILFDSEEEAAAYIVALYGAVSDIYLRDINTRVDLTFVRLWDTPDDLYNGGNPLGEFSSHWQGNMGSVHRDTAQLCSGRRNYPFGGQASLSALCGASGYGVVGYIRGSFPSPDMPSPLHYDIAVTAHELGHNCGAPHTHSIGVDDCDNPAGTPQRGPIMSYCAQTWSGGDALRDLYFHTAIRSTMYNHVYVVNCIADDCNNNGVDDVDEILLNIKLDTNNNGLLDMCEDCNDNGQLDPFETSQGTSPDLNGNGIPDSCEADCDGDDVPDDHEIAIGTDTDLYGNGLPDSCEADCNGNGQSDYNELQSDLTLDIDRNAVLDDCQDCDDDGTNDLVALGGAHDLWISSGLAPEPLRRFQGAVGALVLQSSVGGAASINAGNDVVVAPDGAALVSSAVDDRILAFDMDGNYLGDHVSAGSGGLNGPAGMIFDAEGDLLVASYNSNEVLRYDGQDGTFMGELISPGQGGLNKPFGLTFGPNGNLFVSCDDHRVREYTASGNTVGVFVPFASGGLFEPRGLLFKPDGHLLVASHGSDQVLEYDGTTGAFRRNFALVGTNNVLNLASPWGMRIGPNGNLYVSRTGTGFEGGEGDLHLSNAQMYEFDISNGNFLRTHIGGNDHGLLFPTGFDFIDGWDIDCNVNFIQDDCDIASGFSSDTDVNGVPDECQIDCNNNGVWDRQDIIPFGPSLDCNYNTIPDECDPDCNNNGLADDCELAEGTVPDCNVNGIPDSCDVDQGTSDDCDNNAVLDECDTEIMPNPVQVLHSNAGSDDGVDFDVRLATDGDGNWVAVWRSSENLFGTLGIDYDILVSRSGNNGVSWSSPQPLNNNAAGDVAYDFAPSVATDGNGLWLVAWESAENIGGSGSDSDIYVARSVNAGASWSDPELLNNDGTSDFGDDAAPQIVSDQRGQWGAVWSTTNGSAQPHLGDRGIVFAQSSDNGLNWSDPQFVSAVPAPGEDNTVPKLATTGTGHWIALWQSNDDLDGMIDTDMDLISVFSDDNGATWSTPLPLNTTATTDVGQDTTPTIAYDGLGGWIAVWSTTEDLGGTAGTDSDIAFARSDDGGATWSDPQLVNSNADSDSGIDRTPQIVSNKLGVWLVAWESSSDIDGIETDLDVLYSRSDDGGTQWSAPVPLNINADSDDGSDVRVDVQPGSAGQWVGAWSTTATLGGQLEGDLDLLFTTFDILSDCNQNGTLDVCELDSGAVDDDNDNNIPDECELQGCVTTADCADTDGNSVRDDGCVWWACSAGVCQGTDIVYADFGSSNGNCAVDGTADGNDRFHALNCFSDQTTAGVPGYPCELAPPMAMNVDAAGLDTPCTPDGVCDGNDAFAALNAFDNSTTCSCSGGGPAPDDGPAVLGPPARLRLHQHDRSIPGLIEVDVLLESPLRDLRGYQLHVGVSGGRRGRLLLVDIAVQDRKDHVFAGVDDWRAFNLQTSQVLVGVDTAGVPAPAGAYLATLTFRGEDDAAGRFAVELLEPRTILFGSGPGERIPVEPSDALILDVRRARTR